MPIIVTLKHGDVNRHHSMIAALHDYMECIDNPPGHGAEMWWEEDSVTVYVCDDCIMAAVNDEWPDRDAELADLIAARDNGTAPWLYDRRLEREPDPLALLTDGDVLVDDCDDDHEEHFSWSPCDTCGSRLGGNRHRASIIRF